MFPARAARVKRDLFIWQKRPTHMSKETYSYVKSDLIIWQKRPHHMAKEAYLQVSKEAISYVKRDLIPPRTPGSQALRLCLAPSVLASDLASRCRNYVRQENTFYSKTREHIP